jgi:hypothetical protein
LLVLRRALMGGLKPEELRQRARELLDAATTITDPKGRTSLIQLAAYYEELAVKLDAPARPPVRRDAGPQPGGQRH